MLLFSISNTRVEWEGVVFQRNNKVWLLILVSCSAVIDDHELGGFKENTLLVLFSFSLFYSPEARSSKSGRRGLTASFHSSKEESLPGFI